MSRSPLTLVKNLSKLQVFRFIAVGFLCFLIEFFAFNILVDLLHIKYTSANMPAMGLAIVCNYFLTRKLVFEPSRYNNRLTFLLFITFTLMGAALNQFFLWFLAEQLDLNVKLSKVMAVGSVAVFNYFTKKHVVF